MAKNIAVPNSSDVVTADTYVSLGNRLSVSFPGFTAEANGAVAVAFLAIMIVAITFRRRPPRRE